MTHPLLKNFGTGFNRVRINVAQNNMEISKYQLKATVMNLVVDVQQTYWDLVLAANDLATRRQSLEVAQHLQGRTAEMIKEAFARHHSFRPKPLCSSARLTLSLERMLPRMPKRVSKLSSISIRSWRLANIRLCPLMPLS